MSKIQDYEYSRKTKYFFSFSNSDGVAGFQSASNFQVLCNNNLLTNTTGGGKPTNVLFNPIICSIDLKYYNVSEVLKNNKIRVSSTMFAGSPIIITIPSGYYSVLTLASTLQSQLVANVLYTGTPNYVAGWVVDVQNGSQIRIRFTAAFTGTSASTKIEFAGFNGVDSRSLLGFSGNSVDIAYADRATGATGTLAADLLPYDTLRICSKNLAKRFYVMRNGYLSNSDVLFEIPLKDYQVGATVLFETTDNTLEQEINPDFSTIDFMVKDKSDNIIEFDSTAQFHINFSLTREIFYQSPEEKLKQIQNYATYIS
jgi:hypothetical protein